MAQYVALTLEDLIDMPLEKISTKGKWTLYVLAEESGLLPDLDSKHKWGNLSPMQWAERLKHAALQKGKR